MIVASCSLDLGEFLVAQESRRAQPLRVQQRAAEVVRQKLAILRRDELPDLGRELALDAARPERHSGVYPRRSCIARVSVMSFTCTASWPMRSAAVNAVALRSMLSRSES